MSQNQSRIQEELAEILKDLDKIENAPKWQEGMTADEIEAYLKEYLELIRQQRHAQNGASNGYSPEEIDETDYEVDPEELAAVQAAVQEYEARKPDSVSNSEADILRMVAEMIASHQVPENSKAKK